jgi:hypothetical protein
MKTLVIRVVPALLTLAAALPVSATSDGDGERQLFLDAAVEDTATDQVTLPIYRGVDARGRVFWYTITEASTRAVASRYGVNVSRKLANASNTAAVQRGSFRGGVLHVQATVDFSPVRAVVPDPDQGFPPLTAAPGAVGKAGYSPLVQLPNGVVINAPHIGNDSGLHDKLVGTPNYATGTAKFQESEGFYEGKEVYYVSFDASAPDVAALEAATYVPALNAAPGLGSNDKKKSARSGIVPFANGQTGADNPNRQGLNSALLGEGDPLNVVQTEADDNEYSPLWDVHIGVWSPAAISAGKNVLQTDFDEIVKLGRDGLIVGPSGAFGAVGVIVNCPLISIED